MKDQYGNRIPENLVVLNDTMPQVFTEEELKKIDLLDWYEDEGLIFIPFVEGLTDCLTAAEKYGLRESFNKIDSCLHRWNDVDGFYHA